MDDHHAQSLSAPQVPSGVGGLGGVALALRFGLVLPIQWKMDPRLTAYFYLNCNFEPKTTETGIWYALDGGGGANSSGGAWQRQVGSYIW